MPRLKLSLKTPNINHKHLIQIVETSNLNVGLNEIQFQPIKSQTTNQVFIVTTEKSNFILKHFTDNAFLPVDRAKQFNLQLYAYSINFAPEPVWLSDDKKWMIERYTTCLTPNASIQKLAEILTNIHNHTATGYELMLVDKWQKYCKLLGEENHLTKAFTDNQRNWQDLQSNLGYPHVLCHNDLQFAHVTGEQCICLDWEYAGHHCRFFDICCAILINQLSDDEQFMLLTEYANVSNMPFDVLNAAVNNTMPFVDYTFALWEEVFALSCEETYKQ